MDIDAHIDFTHPMREQPPREPMITMTVRQRDYYLYRIKELEAETAMLKARIKKMGTHDDT